MTDIAERALHTRIARSVDATRRSFVDNLFYVTGRTIANASSHDLYTALAFTIRDRMLARMLAADEIYRRRGAKTVAYLSAEFLVGPHLANNMLNLKLTDNVREAVGAENFFLFGQAVEQVAKTWARGYQPREIYERDLDLRGAIDLINSGLFSHGDAELFRPLTDNLLWSDPFLVCADFRDYVECQERAGQTYRDPEDWSRMSILNVARCGRFSSDRAIRDYNLDVWKARPLPVTS
jgi:glucan phosphorylase